MSTTQTVDAPLNYKEEIVKKGSVLRFRAPGYSGENDKVGAYFRVLEMSGPYNNPTATVVLIATCQSINTGLYQGLGNNYLEFIGTGSARTTPYTSVTYFKNPSTGEWLYDDVANKYSLLTTDSSEKDIKITYSDLNYTFKTFLENMSINSTDVYASWNGSSNYVEPEYSASRYTEAYKSYAYKVDNIPVDSSATSFQLMPLSVKDIENYFGKKDFSGVEIAEELLGGYTWYSGNILYISSGSNGGITAGKLIEPIAQALPFQGAQSCYTLALSTNYTSYPDGYHVESYFGGGSNYYLIKLKINLKKSRDWWKLIEWTK